jgi:alpha-tubulin suppressor-like RCC1 family protein
MRRRGRREMSRVKAAQIAGTAGGNVYIVDKDGVLWEAKNPHESTFLLNRIGIGYKWNQIACGYDCLLTIREDRTLWGVGNNEYGQIGGLDGHRRLTQIEKDNDWIQVACGQHHTVAIKTDGTLWGLGFNDYGQIGNNIWETNIFTQIETATDWVQVACGDRHTVAIKTDGTLWGLGYNTPRGKLTKIGRDNDWIRVACGGLQTVAIKQNGTLWGRGDNPHRQIPELGTESTLDRIGGTMKWTHVACGPRYFLAIDTQGTLWECGCFYNCRMKLNPISIGCNWVDSVDTGQYRASVDSQGQVFIWIKAEDRKVDLKHE